MSKWDSKYSDDFLAKALECYFAIAEDNVMPDELISMSQQRGERATFDSPVILKADLDRGLDCLSPGRWFAICNGISLDDFFTDGTRQHLSRILFTLNMYQQAVIRHHWLQLPGEWENARRARKMMLKYLNKGIRPVKDPLFSEVGRIGGLARARNQTPEQRKELAQLAAKTRWNAKPLA